MPDQEHYNPNVVDPVVWAHIFVATILVGLRIWYRSEGQRKLWWDDIFLVTALFFLLGTGAMFFEFDRTSSKESPQDHYVMTGSLLGLFNSLTLALSKTALGITLTRIFKRWWNVVIWFTIVLTNIVFIIQALSFWFKICGMPFTPYRLPTACVYNDDIWFFRIAVQVISCLVDLFFAVIPWQAVKKVYGPRYERISIAISMGFGILAVAFGIVRVVELAEFTNSPEELEQSFVVVSSLWSFIEPADTIIAATIPQMRRIIVDFFCFDSLVEPARRSSTPAPGRSATSSGNSGSTPQSEPSILTKLWWIGLPKSP